MRGSFLIDGFNVYHSVCDALANKCIKHGKWLNYYEFCKYYLGPCGDNSQLAEIYYFSAIAKHLSDPAVVARHHNYIRALQSVGVKVVLGNFKKKSLKCKAQCKQPYSAHEEKESDVNLALMLIESFMLDRCDTAVIVSGDTDLVSAVSKAKELFPQKKVRIAFPYKRHNNHFLRVADSTFKIRAEAYELCQFPDPLVLPDGSSLSKPSTW